MPRTSKLDEYQPETQGRFAVSGMSWPIVQIEGYEVAWMLDNPRALISDIA